MNAIERAAREAVPALADFSLVHMVDGAVIRCVAGAHVSPAGRALVRALMRRGAIRRTDLVSTAAHVIRTERPTLRAHIGRRSSARRPVEARPISSAASHRDPCS